MIKKKHFAFKFHILRQILYVNKIQIKAEVVEFNNIFETVTHIASKTQNIIDIWQPEKSRSKSIFKSVQFI